MELILASSQVSFLTPVFHPNVYENNSVNFSCFTGGQWSPTWGIIDVIYMIESFLTHAHYIGIASVFIFFFYTYHKQTNKHPMRYRSVRGSGKC